MYPSKDNAHETTAISLLTDHYRTKFVIPGLVRAFARQVQVAEDAIWGVIESFYLANDPVGNQLDALGSIVGVARQGANDKDYLALVRLQIRVNRSQGLAEDIIQVMTLTDGVPPKYHEDFQNPWSGMFIVETWDMSSPAFVAKQIKRCRTAGVYGELRYSTWPDGQDLQLVSRNVTLPGQQGWGSRYDHSVGGLMVGAEPI